MVAKEPERAAEMFRLAIAAGERVDSAVKDLAVLLKAQGRAEEAIGAVQGMRGLCSEEAQEALDNILLDLYKVREGGGGSHCLIGSK